MRHFGFRNISNVLATPDWPLTDHPVHHGRFYNNSYWRWCACLVLRFFFVGMSCKRVVRKPDLGLFYGSLVLRRERSGGCEINSGKTWVPSCHQSARWPANYRPHSKRPSYSPVSPETMSLRVKSQMVFLGLFDKNTNNFILVYVWSLVLVSLN